MLNFRNKHFRNIFAILIALGLAYGSWRLFTGLGGITEVDPKAPFVEFSCTGKTFSECTESYDMRVEKLIDDAHKRMKEITEAGMPKKGDYFDHVTEPTCRKYVKEEVSANPSCIALFAVDLHQLYLREVNRCYRGQKLVLPSYKCPEEGGDDFVYEKTPEDDLISFEQASQIFDEQMQIRVDLKRLQLDVALRVFDTHYRDFAFHVDQLRVIDAAKKYRSQVKKTTPDVQKLPCKYNLATSETCQL